MGKAQLILEIIVALQGTQLADFATENFQTVGDRVAVVCAERTTLKSSDGEACKRSVATAIQRYSYLFNGQQLGVLADLYVDALDRLEPEAQLRVRTEACDTDSPTAQRDPLAARAICRRLSRDY
jgi:hypothetical protein